MPKFTIRNLVIVLLTLSVGSTSKAAWLDFFNRSRPVAEAAVVGKIEPIQIRAYAADNGAVIIQIGSHLLYGAHGLYSEQGIIGEGMGGGKQSTSYIAIQGEPSQEGSISDSQLTLFTDRHRALNRKIYTRLDAETEKNLAVDFQNKKMKILRNPAREPKMVFEGMSDGKKWTLLIDKSSAYAVTSSAHGFAKEDSHFAGPTTRERVYIGSEGNFYPVPIENSERHFPHFEYLVKPDGDIIQLLRSPIADAQGQPNGVKIVATFRNSEGNTVIAERVLNVPRGEFANTALDGYDNKSSEFRFVGQPVAKAKSIRGCRDLF